MADRIVQVGDANADHRCWVRPEDMETPRTAYKVDMYNPGSDLAGETAAALAASSIVFKRTDPKYAKRLLDAAKEVSLQERSVTPLDSENRKSH